jgi:hypothetical protein
LNPRPGDYAFAFHSGIITVEENSHPSLPFIITANAISNPNFSGKYSLSNASGQLLFKGKVSDGMQLDISRYAKGIYFLELNSVTYKVFLK